MCNKSVKFRILQVHKMKISHADFNTVKEKQWFMY